MRFTHVLTWTHTHTHVVRCGLLSTALDSRVFQCRERQRHHQHPSTTTTLRLTNMEVDGMVPWKTTFLYKRGAFHFHTNRFWCNASLTRMCFVLLVRNNETELGRKERQDGQWLLLPGVLEENGKIYKTWCFGCRAGSDLSSRCVMRRILKHPLQFGAISLDATS